MEHGNARTRRSRFIQTLIIIFLLLAAIRIFFPSQLVLPWFYRCRPVDPETKVYLVKACEYVRRHGIRSAAGNPINRSIVEIVEEPYVDGSMKIMVFLDCCGDTGDMILVDKESGEVVGYSKGFFVY